MFLSIQNVTVFRICAKPPPLLAQAQAVQWRQPGHDHGGAPGRCGDQQQQHSVGEKVFSVLQKFLCKSNIRTCVCDHSIMQESGVNHQS